MRVLIDEDTAVQVMGPLRHVLLGHQVTHVSEVTWKGKKDRQVLPDAKKAGYHVLITRDRAQLNDPRECDAIKKFGTSRSAH
jgi:PIN like domain